MGKFKEFLNEGKKLRVVVKRNNIGWEIKNNILSNIGLELYKNEYGTGYVNWFDTTPKDFQKMTGNVSLVADNRQYILGDDVNQGYLEWSRGETKEILELHKNALEFWLKVYMDKNKIQYENNYNKYYLYYRKTNTIYNSSKTKKTRFITNLENFGISSDESSYGNMEIISYDEAKQLKAKNLEKYK